MPADPSAERAGIQTFFFAEGRKSQRAVKPGAHQSDLSLTAVLAGGNTCFRFGHGKSSMAKPTKSDFSRQTPILRTDTALSVKVPVRAISIHLSGIKKASVPLHCDRKTEASPGKDAFCARFFVPLPDNVAYRQSLTILTHHQDFSLNQTSQTN